MTVFGIGTLELVVILLFMILIFGPDRIYEMGKWLGQAYRKLTGMTTEVNQQMMDVRKAMNSTLDLPNVSNPIADLKKDITEMQRELTQPFSQVANEVKDAQKEMVQATTEPRIAPPAAVEEEE